MAFSPFSHFTRRTSDPLDDLLDAHADALLHGAPGIDALLQQYDRATAEQAADLMRLAERVGRSLTGVQPDERFVRELRQQLLTLDLPAPSLWGRIRQLPPRTQIAAASIGGATLTVTAGVVWIAWRSDLGGLLEQVRRRIAAA